MAEERIVNHVIVQCGVDFESRPLLAIFPSYLPDPSSCDMNLLLDLILSKLREFVESDYVIVYFNAVLEHRPSISWLTRAYRSLDRTYRKNLKQLIVVHPSAWIKFIMNMMKSFISPKFGKKLFYVESLSELAKMVPIHQIIIPQCIYEYNEKIEKNEFLPNFKKTPSGLFFGQPLDNEAVIPTLESLLGAVKKNGIETVGIFRRSPVSTQLSSAKERLDKSLLLNWDSEDIHVIAVLIKMFFRELPTAVIPKSVATALSNPNCDIEDLAKKCLSSSDDDNEFFGELERKVLFLLLETLSEIASHSETNRMNASNLAIVFAPNIIRSDSPSESLFLVGKLTPLLTRLIELTKNK